MSYLQKYFKQVKENDRSSAAIAVLAGLDHIKKSSKDVAESIIDELKDQRSFLKLIASENYSSLAVQLAMGNWLTDKYSEGVPLKRFYAGCENVDRIELLGIETAKKVFGADHAYLQPHSGADANLVAIWAIIIQKVQTKALAELGKKTLEELTPDQYEEIRKILVSQKLMGMGLTSGGHLSHGYLHNISSKMIRSVSYSVDLKTGLLDYNQIKQQAEKEKPLILIAGYSAYPRLINFAKMKEIASSVGAVLLVDMAHFAGLVAGKALTGEYNPVPYADIITTTTHKTLRGPRGGLILCTEEFKDTIDKGCPLVLGGPMPHIMAAKTIALQEANGPKFCQYAKKIIENAKFLAEFLKEKGLKIVTDGTDNHIVLIDVFSSFGLLGRQAESGLRQSGLTCNRNTIPGDKNGAWYTSGVRLGTPAITTLGMGRDEMKTIANIIYDVLKHAKAKAGEEKLSKSEVEIEQNILKKCRAEVKELLNRFPLYPEIIIS